MHVPLVVVPDALLVLGAVLVVPADDLAIGLGHGGVVLPRIADVLEQT